MALDVDSAPAAVAQAPTPHSRVSALWDRPRWAHLAALAALLLLVVPVVGTSTSFLADEGAAVIQARSLAAGEGWLVEHPFPEVDPDGVHYPIVNAERGPLGWAPLAKHPLYPFLLAGAHRAAGVAGMVLLSVAGTVVAAGLAGALARRLDPVLERPAIWTVGLASPLLFDSFLVMGHTLAAALATGAVLAAAVAVERHSPRLALAVIPCIGGAVLLRNEALLFALALAVTAGAVAAWRRPRLPAAVVAIGAVGAAVLAHAVNEAWALRTVGGAAAMAAPVPVQTGNFLGDRLQGFFLTWLAPGYGGSPVLVLSLVTMVAAIAVGGFRARTRPHGRAGILLPGAVAAVAASVALAAAPATVVPGLLVAFPLAVAGTLLLRRRLFRSPAPVLAGGTFALFSLLVIATQYSTGGTGEWGGRYFAIGLPAIVPVLLLALRDGGLALDRDVRRRAAGALVACSLALSTMAVVALRSNHEQKAQLVAAIERGGREAGPGRAVVVATLSPFPRQAWPTFENHRWLVTEPSQLGDLRRRLEAAGVGRFVLVTHDLAVYRGQLAGLEIVWSDGAVRDWGRQVLVVREAGLRGPNAEHGLRGPNAADGLRGPNAEHGLRGPNAEHGLRGPNAEHGLRGPNAADGLRGPNAVTAR